MTTNVKEEQGFVYLTHNESTALQKQIRSARDASIISLMISAGLTLNEITQLKTKDLNWPNKELTIKEGRTRTVPLTGETMAFLTAWTQKRVDCKTTHLFITEKGAVKPLSARSVDNLIRKYAKKGGLNKVANAQILRNTYAVRLFETGLNEQSVSELLGVNNQRFLKRYKHAANQRNTHIQEETLPTKEAVQRAISNLDTRSIPQKIGQSLFQKQPKQNKLLSQLDGPIKPHPKEVLFGRVTLLRDLQSGLKRSQSQLVIGLKGSGKTHVFKHLCNQEINDLNSLYIDMSRPMKRNIQSLASALDPNYESALPSRPSIDDHIDWIANHPMLQRQLLFLDNVDAMPVNSVSILKTLLNKTTVLASCTSIPKKLIDTVRTLKQHPLTPLTEEAANALIDYLTQNMSITDRPLLTRELMEKSNQYPGPIVDMVTSLYHNPVVDSDAIRQLKHDSAVTYRDWSTMIIILWGILIMFRFIALGTHSVEGYVLAGFGTSILVTVRFFAGRMR